MRTAGPDASRASPGPVGRVLALGEALLVTGTVAGIIAALRQVGFESYRGPVAIALGLLVATLLLRRHGRRWRDLGLRRPARWRGVLSLALFGMGATFAVMVLFQGLLLPLLGLDGPDLSHETKVRTSPLDLFLRLTLVSWGTAAFAEEMVARGFVLSRLETALGGGRLALTLAVLGQAALFGAGHVSQGLGGQLMTGAIGMVMAWIYLRGERNLWAPILAHGMLDTVGFTAIYFGLGGP